jgi:teichuronic acid biosynthesis glycosyltransferase TuaC
MAFGSAIAKYSPDLMFPALIDRLAPAQARTIHIGVVTPLFPSAGEPYRGAPIWHTLRELSAFADLAPCCIQPRYPRGLTPRSFRYHRHEADTSFYGINSQTLAYFTVPGAVALNGRLIRNALRSAWRDRRPDLILSYWGHPEGYAAVRLGKECNIPVVVGVRGSDFLMAPPRGIVRRQIEYTARNASAILSVSGELSRVALGLGAKRVHTILNGVDPAIFHIQDQPAIRERLGLPADETCVLFVGWLSKLKGVAQLVEAIAALNRSGGRKWSLAMVGEGYLEPALREEARRSGFGSSFRFLGPLKAPDIAQWMNACDLFCLPSDSEGCPNVVLEALSCGTPVVATAVGSIPDLVDESCGILVPGNSPDILAATLQRAGARSWDRPQIALSQQRTWRAVALETLAACRQALEEK